MQGKQTAPTPLLLTAREAAATLRISERLLWSLTHDGTLPCVRIGRAVRYELSDLRAFIAAQKQGGVA